MNGLLNSCKGLPRHEECSTYSGWKNKHGEEAAIQDQCTSPCQKKSWYIVKLFKSEEELQVLIHLAKKKRLRPVSIHTPVTTVTFSNES